VPVFPTGFLFFRLTLKLWRTFWKTRSSGKYRKYKTSHSFNSEDSHPVNQLRKGVTGLKEVHIDVDFWHIYLVT